MGKLILFIILMLMPFGAFASDQPEVSRKLDLSPEAIERGKAAFMAHCMACHGVKYAGIQPAMDAAAAEVSFGVAPPDLSLITSARGKGTEGAVYIYRLLTTYYLDEKGQVKNLAFKEETQGDGTIAMPQPIASDDPQLQEKAMDIAAYLHRTADPYEVGRVRIGKYVIAYMVILTAFLFALNRITWKDVKKPK